MSTKIYYAYRIPLGKLDRFLDLTRERLFSSAVHQINGWMKLYGDDEIGVPPANMTKRAFAKWRRRRRYEIVEGRCVEASKDSHRGPFDVDCGFNMWFEVQPHLCLVYIVPIMQYNMMGALRCLPRWAQDFSYWDNTDPPSHISEKAWKERGAAWERICTGEGTSSHNARRLFHEVISMRSFVGRFQLQEMVLHRR